MSVLITNVSQNTLKGVVTGVIVVARVEAKFPIDWKLRKEQVSHVFFEKSSQFIYICCTFKNNRN